MLLQQAYNWIAYLRYNWARIVAKTGSVHRRVVKLGYNMAIVPYTQSFLPALMGSKLP